MHGKVATPENETRHARFPHPNPPPESEKLLAGHPVEGANESLREFHIKDSGLHMALIVLKSPRVRVRTLMDADTGLQTLDLQSCSLFFALHRQQFFDFTDHICICPIPGANDNASNGEIPLQQICYRKSKYP